MLNIVIPMAGAGSRFKAQGYDLPKPFIDINGKMMIEHVLDGINYPNAHYTLIIQKQFETENRDQLEKLSKHYHVAFLSVDKLTQGACCTPAWGRWCRGSWTGCRRSGRCSRAASARR